MSLDRLRWNRSTYSLLDWMGDLGGLFDALMTLCSLLVAPLANFSMKMTLMTTFF